MPLVFGLTFCGLVFSTQAMFGDQLPRLQTIDPLEPFQALLFPTRLVVSLSPTPAYTQISAVRPSQTLVVFQPTDTATPWITLTVFSPSPTWPTPTETNTLTPTDTPTPSVTSSETGTATNTFTNTPTASSTWTPRPSSTFTRTPSRTPQATTPPPPTQTPSSTEVQPTDSASVTSPPASATAEPTNSSCDSIGNSAYEDQLLQYINDERSQAGVPPLAMQSQLRAAARVHSTDMACNNFISHTGSDGSRPADRVRDQGYSFSWIGENIFSTGNNSNAPLQTITWWMNSTPHRNNILSPNYTEIGLGYIYDADSSNRGYFTAVFARP